MYRIIPDSTITSTSDFGDSTNKFFLVNIEQNIKVTEIVYENGDPYAIITTNYDWDGEQTSTNTSFNYLSLSTTIKTSSSGVGASVSIHFEDITFESSIGFDWNTFQSYVEYSYTVEIETGVYLTHYIRFKFNLGTAILLGALACLPSFSVFLPNIPVIAQANAY